jgi:Lar family restriction alleviation protein
MRVYVQKHGLASCPFCGGPATHRQVVDGDRIQFYVGCLSCAAHGPWCKSGKAGAAMEWNRRARQFKVKPAAAPDPR